MAGYFAFNLPEESVHLEGGTEDLRKVIPLPIPMKANQIIGYYVAEGQGPPSGFNANLKWELPDNMKPRDVTGEGLTLNKDAPPGVLTLKDGWFCALSEKVRVSSLYEMFVDVTGRHGKIEVKASVKCHASVTQGAEIISGGDVEIAGLVEDATIKAKGNIIAKGGIAGGGTGKLSAGKNIYTQFCQQATLEAPGNVVVDGPVMNSNILCGKVLTIRPPGLLVGGHVRARELVEVERVGSAAALRTEIDLGANPFQRVEIETMQEDTQQLEEEYGKIMIAVKHMEEDIPGEIRFQKANMQNTLFNTAEYLQQEGENLDEDQLERLNKFGSGVMRLMRMTEELTIKKRELNEKSEGEVWYDKARIKIAKIAHPGTIIRIQDAVLAMDKEYEQSAFYYKAGDPETNKKGEIEISFMESTG